MALRRKSFFLFYIYKKLISVVKRSVKAHMKSSLSSSAGMRKVLLLGVLVENVHFVHSLMSPWHWYPITGPLKYFSII